jgi:hypothetical protein
MASLEKLLLLKLKGIVFNLSAVLLSELAPHSNFLVFTVFKIIFECFSLTDEEHPKR